MHVKKLWSPSTTTNNISLFTKYINNELQSKSYKDFKGRKVLNVLNQENKKLFLSINCDTNELDVRIPGRKWTGSKPAKEEFENNLINDFC